MLMGTLPQKGVYAQVLYNAISSFVVCFSTIVSTNAILNRPLMATPSLVTLDCGQLLACSAHTRVVPPLNLGSLTFSIRKKG